METLKNSLQDEIRASFKGNSCASAKGGIWWGGHQEYPCQAVLDKSFEIGYIAEYYKRHRLANNWYTDMKVLFLAVRTYRHVTGNSEHVPSRQC